MENVVSMALLPGLGFAAFGALILVFSRQVTRLMYTSPLWPMKNWDLWPKYQQVMAIWLSRLFGLAALILGVAHALGVKGA